MARTSSSLDPRSPGCAAALDDAGAEQQHVALADEPLGAGLVEDDPAVGWREDTAKARRAGMLALMTPVMTLTDGRWVAMTRWMPTARAIWGDAADRLLDVAGRHHHQVVELVDHDEDERQPLVLDARIARLRAARSPRSNAAL